MNRGDRVVMSSQRKITRWKKYVLKRNVYQSSLKAFLNDVSQKWEKSMVWNIRNYHSKHIFSCMHIMIVKENLENSLYFINVRCMQCGNNIISPVRSICDKPWRKWKTNLLREWEKFFLLPFILSLRPELRQTLIWKRQENNLLGSASIFDKWISQLFLAINNSL